jgi:hypothetical protein
MARTQPNGGGDPVWRGPENAVSRVTKPEKSVTKLRVDVTQLEKRKVGRPAKHASHADRQRAYRERKANAEIIISARRSARLSDSWVWRGNSREPSEPHFSAYRGPAIGILWGDDQRVIVRRLGSQRDNSLVPKRELQHLAVLKWLASTLLIQCCIRYRPGLLRFSSVV